MLIPFRLLTLLNGLDAAVDHGILIKDGRALERLAQVDTVLFDKTGTLTLEQPRVAQVHALPGDDEARVLRLAAAAEQRQQHPIARAILAAAASAGWRSPRWTAPSSSPAAGSMRRSTACGFASAAGASWARTGWPYPSPHPRSSRRPMPAATAWYSSPRTSGSSVPWSWPPRCAPRRRRHRPAPGPRARLLDRLRRCPGADPPSGRAPGPGRLARRHPAGAEGGAGRGAAGRGPAGLLHRRRHQRRHCAAPGRCLGVAARGDHHGHRCRPSRADGGRPGAARAWLWDAVRRLRAQPRCQRAHRQGVQPERGARRAGGAAGAEVLAGGDRLVRAVADRDRDCDAAVGWDGGCLST
jgi:hypothetical protein